MLCQILKTFPYSEDGKSELMAHKGETVDIPADLVAGLEAEGYLTPKGAPENKMDDAPRETGAVVDKPTEGGDTEAGEGEDGEADAELAEARADYAEEFGREAPKNWKAETIRTKIIEA